MVSATASMPYVTGWISATRMAAGNTSTTSLVRHGLSDQEVADILGWSANQVANIRKIYVQDDAAIQAIGERIAKSQRGI